MAPRRKAVAKSTDVVTTKIPEDLPNITIRRCVKENTSMDSMHVMESPHVVENIPDIVTEINKLDFNPEHIENEEELPKKSKKITKAKPKTKKPTPEENFKIKKTRKRAMSEDRQTASIEVEVVNRRKKPIDKDTSESLKSISPLNELPKRNRRAASVDIIPSDSTLQVTKKNQKVPKTTVVTDDEAPKKNKKETKITEKNSKGKKNIKKILNDQDEHDVLEQEQINNESIDLKQDTPKSNQGYKKEQINKHNVEEKGLEKEFGEGITEQNTIETDLEQPDLVAEEILEQNSSKNQTFVKVKETSERDNEKIQKQRILKSKKKNNSPEKLEENNKKSDTEDFDIVINNNAKIKPKRGVRRVKEDVAKQNDIEVKEIKVQKRGRKVKKEIEELIVKNSPPADNEEEKINIEVGNFLDSSPPDTSESEKNNAKPKAVKRKTKAKSTKK